jgi:hypothetical protein
MTKFIVEPGPNNHYHLDHINLIRESYQRLLGRELIPGDPLAAAKAIYHAPFVLVSHNTAADPIFNYGNRTALELFEMTWAEFTALPSRKSAELPNREERARLLAEVTAKGFIDDYCGIRISKTGKRFELKNVTVWNLHDPDGTPNGIYRGQAATWRDWQYL